MSEPVFKIELPAKAKSKFVWVPPLCRVISGYDDWDESDPEFPCFVNGCRNIVELEYFFYKEGCTPDLKQVGKYTYDSRRYYAVLNCGCQAPVCEDCSAECSFGPCRVCGQEADIDIEFKGLIMEDKNWLEGETNRGFWMMILTDAEQFIEENIGRNYPFFLKWYLAQGGEIDITEMNTPKMCKYISDFKLFCLKWVFLKSTFAVIRQISVAPLASICDPRLDIFMKQSAEFLGSLRFIIFRKKDLERYRFFGFMMKMIAKITRDTVVYIGGRENQIFATYLRRFYARLLTKF
jgi:hypothetical protein